MGHDIAAVQALFAISIGLTIVSATIEIHKSVERRTTYVERRTTVLASSSR